MTEPVTIPAPTSVLSRRQSAALLGMWLVGVLAYVISISNRTALSALGLDTAAHFGIDATTLSLFAVLQLAVYGALQLPVGLALDRFGPRTVLTVGMVVLTISQTVLALAPDVGVAIAARLLLGAGDAAIFPSLLRVIGVRFPRKLAPLMVQLTGLLGQFGQIISVIPFAALVRATGWASGFIALAATTALVGVLVWVVIREDGTAAPTTGSLRSMIAASWRSSGTRVGFWTHFVTSFSGNAFAVLWGYPFLQSAQGLSSGDAELLFTLYVVFGLAAGPIIGVLSARFAPQRIWLVVSLVLFQALTWVAVLGTAGNAPFSLLVVLALAMSVGGPASLLAFDFAREANPAERLGTATGVVNGAGFLSSVLVILLIGVVLTARGGGEYTLDAFTWAELVQVPFWLGGLALLLWEWLRSARAAA